jgi:hypothetical protein
LATAAGAAGAAFWAGIKRGMAQARAVKNEIWQQVLFIFECSEVMIERWPLNICHSKLVAIFPRFNCHFQIFNGDFSIAFANALWERPLNPV